MRLAVPKTPGLQHGRQHRLNSGGVRKTNFRENSALNNYGDAGTVATLPAISYFTDGTEAPISPHIKRHNRGGGRCQQAGTVPCTGQARRRWRPTSFTHSASMNSNADRISPSMPLQVQKVCKTSAKPGQPATDVEKGQASWSCGGRASPTGPPEPPFKQQNQPVSRQQCR